MIAAFDASYAAEGGVSAAAVVFFGYRDAAPVQEYRLHLPSAEDYFPGRFYRRELPAVLALLARIAEAPAELIVDGYVMLGDRRPGLGGRLYAAVHRKIPVIGVAKSRFRGAAAAEVFRGGSSRPLLVTAAGMDLETAAEKIRSMHGENRIPTLLRRVDRLARETGAGAGRPRF